MSSASQYRCLFAICSVLSAGLSQSPASAQTASQITPQSFAPPARGANDSGFTIGAQPGLDAPPGAADLFVTLGGVDVQGGFPELSGPQAELSARLSGKRLSAAEIFAAARELEAAYARAGYVLVRVTLPPQKIVDGARLRLVVIDGFIERIETRNVPGRVRKRIADLLAPLQGKRGLKLRDLERRVLLAGDTPGVILRSTLAPGSVPGAAILVIEAKYQQVAGVFTADNTLSASLGGAQVGVGADFNSVLGLGETAYVRLTGDPVGGLNGLFSDYPRNRILAAGVVAPIGTDGLTLNVEDTQARTTPVATQGLAATDRFQRLSVRVRYPWVRSRQADFATQIAFDAQDETETLLPDQASLPIFADRLRVLRVTGDGDYRTAWGGTFTGTMTASFGLNVLGARTGADASAALPLSRQGADATFSKLDGQIGYSQSLTPHLALSLSARGQTSFGSPLLRSEQIGLAGPDDLSAYDLGMLQGDSGAVGRAELSSPFALTKVVTPVGVVTAPYVFGAVGGYSVYDPTALEPSHVRAGSYGIGLRMGASAPGAQSNGQFTLEFARRTASGGLPDDNRFTALASVRF